MPRFDNWARYARAGSTIQKVNSFAAAQTNATVTWHDLKEFRQVWPRHLVVKGIMHRDDAVRAAAIGVDGIIVSNHGGRQLDQAPSPLEVCRASARRSAIRSR